MAIGVPAFGGLSIPSLYSTFVHSLPGFNCTKQEVLYKASGGVMTARTQQKRPRKPPVAIDAEELPLDIHSVLRKRRTVWKVPELAALLSLDSRTVYRAVSTGQLPATRVGMTVRINPAYALAWIESRTTGVR